MFEPFFLPLISVQSGRSLRSLMSAFSNLAQVTTSLGSLKPDLRLPSGWPDPAEVEEAWPELW